MAEGGACLHLRKHIQKSHAGEDFCFACGLRGSLVECECCPKAYHSVCLGGIDFADSEFFQCPWHFCKECGTNNAQYVDQISIVCTKCPTSYCPSCVPAHIAKRLRDCEVSQPTSALYDVHSRRIEKFMNRHHKGQPDVDAARWCAGMLPVGSMAFVCDTCQKEDSRNTDEYVSKELYQVSLPGGHDLHDKSSFPKEGKREWVAPEQVNLTSTNKELFSRHIEAISVKELKTGTKDITVLRRWTSAGAAAKDLEFGAKLILNSADSYQRWRDEKDDSVVTGCNLVWCYKEDQAVGSDFVGSLYYPDVEVRQQTQAKEELAESRPLCSFKCIQHAIRVMTFGHQEIYDIAFAYKQDEVGKGYTFRFCDDPDIMQHTASGKKGAAKDGVELWKRKKVRDRFVLQRLKTFAKKENEKQEKLLADDESSKRGSTPDPAKKEASSSADIIDLSADKDHEQEQDQEQRSDEEQKSTDEDGEKADALSLVRSSSQGTLVASSASHSPRSTAGGSPRDGGQATPAARMSILLTPSGQLQESSSQRSETSSLETMFKTRKTPVVGPSYQVQADKIPALGKSPKASDERGVGRVWDPLAKVNLTSQELVTLHLAQYMPGLIVKIHPPNPQDGAQGDGTMSMNDVDIVPVIGMVMSEITASATSDITLRLAVDTRRVCTVPLRRVQAIVHEDVLLEVYSKCGQSMDEAKVKVREIIKKHIDAQWTAEQTNTYIRTLDKSKENLKMTHSIITGGPDGASFSRSSMRGSMYSSNNLQGLHSYSTRKVANFWTPMKTIVDNYYQYHPGPEFYSATTGDLDDERAPTEKETCAIREQIIAVHKISADFLLAALPPGEQQEMAMESKEETQTKDTAETENVSGDTKDSAPMKQEQEQEQEQKEENLEEAWNPFELRPARPDDLRRAGFDLAPLPIVPHDSFKADDPFGGTTVGSSSNMKRKREQI